MNPCHLLLNLELFFQNIIFLSLKFKHQIYQNEMSSQLKNEWYCVPSFKLEV